MARQMTDAQLLAAWDAEAYPEWIARHLAKKAARRIVKPLDRNRTLQAARAFARVYEEEKYDAA